MKVIGVTGGIGSGKTTVVNEFKKISVPVYIADERSKYLLAHDADIITEVSNLLGDEAYVKKEDQIIPNKAFIASQVFNDSGLLKSLNEILHPAVRKDFEQFLSKQNASYIVYEAAILFESGGDRICDHVILVTAPIEERIKRVISRDEVTESQVRARMKHQWNQLQKLNKSDFVIENTDLNKIPKYVRSINSFLLKK